MTLSDQAKAHRSSQGDRPMRRRTGQATIETTVLVGAVAAALLVMGLYMRRGYQGYLFSGASAHGFQFHPRQAFTTVDSIALFNQTQNIDIISGTAAVRLGRASTPVDTVVSAFYGLDGDKGGQASDGFLQGRALATNTRVDTSWDLQRHGRYESH